MKALNNLGIKRIVYLDDYLRVLDGSDGTKKKAEPEARELAIKRGIICEQFRFEEKTKPSKTNITNVTLDKKEEKRF
jgi:deoxycytidylate deaminase